MKRMRLMKIICVMFAVMMFGIGVGTVIIFEEWLGFVTGAFVIGGLCVIGAVVLHITQGAIRKMPIEKCFGRILEKDNVMVSVEFSNGNRKKMTYEPNLIITPGDEGEIEYRDKAGLVVGFTKKDM
ncbi:MAG: hypothetical protein IJ427_13850 [Lachnospiraceae bacterium]|nr:hypothetical protein [Lachnospiraceae bacterium]